MPDEIKPDAGVVEIKQTVEVLDAGGKTLPRETPLASIFDKIADGKEDGKSASDVIKEVQRAPKPEKKEVKAPEPKKEEKPAEVSDLDKKLTEAQNKKDEDKETSRSKLFEDTEEKKTVKEDKKVEDKPAEKSDDDISDDELKVLPHDKPKTAKRIQKLLDQKKELDEVVTRTRAEAAEKATKLAELEKKLTEVKTVDPKTDEAIKKQLDELSMFRRRYDLDKDPEVKTKYDSRIETAETSIIGTLTKVGVSQGVMDIIKEEGGWSKFADSSRVYPLKDGKTVTGAEIAETIMNQLPLSQRRAIDALMIEQVATKRDKERFFAEEQAKATEYFKKQEEEGSKQREAQQNQIKEVAGTIEKWHKEVTEKNDWLKQKPIPDGATAEQKAAIEEDNSYAKKYNALIQKSLSSRDVNESLEIVLDSVKFYQERREKIKLAAENARLKSELEKFKAGARSTPKTGSIVGGGGGAASLPKEKATPQTLDQAFDNIMAGKRVDND